MPPASTARAARVLDPATADGFVSCRCVTLVEACPRVSATSREVAPARVDRRAWGAKFKQD